jgi:hypothetical protein
MQTNILWTGREYYSLENCLVTSNDDGHIISSSIIGSYESVLYRVEYTIETNSKWETKYVDIRCQINGEVHNVQLHCNVSGNWILNNEAATQFKDFLYVDIPLTPFTNTLPINNLKLGVNEEAIIKVIYIDLLANTITPVEERYVLKDGSTYHYENIPNDFEADITVDEDGFVIDYPQLFERTAKTSN